MPQTDVPGENKFIWTLIMTNLNSVDVLWASIAKGEEGEQETILYILEQCLWKMFWYVNPNSLCPEVAVAEGNRERKGIFCAVLWLQEWLADICEIPIIMREY